MIEFVLTKLGGQTLKVDGRLMASAYDPISEGRVWADQRQAFLSSVHSVIILGAGAGYHVSEILRRTAASVLVLDDRQDVIEAVQKMQNFDLQRVHFAEVKTLRDLRASVHVRAAVTQSFVVLSCAASVSLNPDWARMCQEQLLGRNWGSLNWQWQLRGFPDLNSVPRIDANAEPLTIYDLEQTELVGNSQERERLLLKALRELVK